MCGISLILVFIAVIVVNASQNNISARNFNSDCGQVFTKREFIIESARYPSNYPPNYECSYLVKGPTCPTRFTLQFIDFSLEDSLGCSKDRLEVDTKDALCGNKMGIKEYFSEKGTLILRFVSDADITGRGYRILLTRSPCESQQPLSTTTQTVPKWYTTNNEVEYTTTSRPAYDKSKGKCCQTSYSVKKFTLTSPNFPYSMSTPAECVYHIYKTNRKICRLRIDVQFFWSGRPSNNCPEGYLEIDGKRICGCKSDLKLLMSFEGDSPKILRFVSRGYEKDSYSGFVMEIVQDECPKKYVPQESQKNATAEKKFRFYNDQINRIAWPNKSHETVIERLHLISENTEIIDDKNDSDSPPQPQIVRHVYFFSYPDLNRIPRDREETEYVDISSMDSIFVQDNVDYGYCLNWNRKQFSSLSSRSLPVCKINEGNVAAERCVELNQVRGSFKSPGYPFYYPGNMNICYRFNKSPGYCSVRVYMKDFDLQNGVTCENDYLLFANKLRYCGSRLSNTISIVDLRHKPQEQMNFVTDAFYCGRGFYGSYEQIPCQDSSYPINPTTPPNVPKPMTPCSREIQDEMFTFDVYDYNGPSCLLTIRKHREYVCAVKLYFEQFDLNCPAETVVAGGTMYCGRLTGESVRIDFDERRDLPIIYRKSSNMVGGGLRLRIRGEQISDDCPYPEVPAERLVSLKSLSAKSLENNSKFLLKIDNQFEDICGIVTNTTEIKLPETFCNFIMSNHNNVTNCLPLTENSLIVPTESQKIELKIRDVDHTEEIEFQEVDCDKIMPS